MLAKFKQLFTSESGTAAAEYAMILAIIGSALTLACFALSNAITGTVTAAIKFLQSANL